MSLIFRNGRVEDVPAAARLAAHSFPGVGYELDEWEAALTDSPQGGLDTLWVGERDGRVIAACRLLQFRQWIGGAPIPIMGLSTVAISPTERRQGIAAEMTTAALHHSRERGDLATLLYPFRTAFYGQLGYGMAGEVRQYSIPPGALADDLGRSRVVIADSPADRGAIAAIYDRWSPSQTGQLVRSARAWDRVWERGRHGVLYREQDGDPGGYLVYRYHADSARGERSIEVEEIAWLSRDARLGLYGWLASLGDQWERIIYRAHPAEQFAEHLRELRFPTRDITRWHYWFPTAVTMMGPMFRLLDVEGAWAVRPVRAGADLTIALDVSDTTMPDNAGVWTLHLDEMRARISRESSVSASATLEIGIEALSRIYIGALTPTAAVAAGFARFDRAERLAELDRILAVPSPWTFDRF